MDQPLLWLAGLIALVAYVPYIRDTLRGRTRPNRATWWIYTVVGGIGTASTFMAGARWTLVVPAIYAVVSLAVALIAIRRGEGGWSTLDKWCLGTAAASVVVWIATGDPLLAVVMNSAADVAGSVPTMRKAWREPQRENLVGWALFLAANTLTLIELPAWTIAQALYPGALFFCSLVITAGCVRGRWV